MSYFFKQLKRNAETVFIIILLVGALFSLLNYVGNFPNAFMPIVGHLFMMLFEIALLISVPVFMILRKKDVARTIFIIYASFWMIFSVYTNFQDSYMMAPGSHGLSISISVFEFVIACAILTAVGFYLVGYKKSDMLMNNITALILLGCFACYFVVFALSIASYAVFKMDWTNYIANINTNLLLPAAMYLGLFVFGLLDVAFPEKPIVILPEWQEVKDEEAAEDLESGELSAEVSEKEEVGSEEELPADDFSLEPDSISESETEKDQ